MVRVVSMPADGNCLFWALGWWYDVSGPALRNIIIDFLSQHPHHEVQGAPFRDWIRWETDMPFEQYINAMRHGEWGGALEMVIFNALTKSAISVWEIRDNRLHRIAHIDGDDKPHCHLVYLNRGHYGIVTD